MLRLATRCENCMHVDVCNKRDKYELIVDKLDKSEISISLKENSVSFVKLYSDPDFDVSVKCSYFYEKWKESTKRQDFSRFSDTSSVITPPLEINYDKTTRNPSLPIEVTC